ncbi:MAG: DNA-binding protein [Candidatus Methanomethylicaceae archaeon]
MTEEGKDELEAIRAKKMAEFQRRYSTSKQDASRQPKKPEIDDETLVRSNLFERGDEVLNAALVQYPQATRQVISNIAGLFRSGKLKEPIPGEELLALFRDLGMRVHLETTISYLKDGKRITLSDKFKGKKPDD